jgi:hypothetical protein
MAARIAIIAITTSNSINVNALRFMPTHLLVEHGCHQAAMALSPFLSAGREGNHLTPFTT